jgi:zinc transporter ZupT
VLGLSCITPVGAVLGFVMLSSIPASVLGGVLGFAAGTFLFIAACGIIPELLHGHGTDVSKPKLPVSENGFLLFFAL